MVTGLIDHHSLSVDGERCAKTMRVSITALVAALGTDALQLTRRQLAGAAAVFAPTAARADVPVDPFNSMCLGFGCNSPQGVDSPGAPAPTSAQIKCHGASQS